MSFVYWGVLLAVIVLSAAAEKNPKAILTRKGQPVVRPDPIAALLLALALILVAGFRYRVGTDFTAYYRMRVADWKQVFQDFVGFSEGGFTLLSKLSSLVWDNGQSLIFISAAITIGLYAWTIYRYSPMYLLSMLLYLFLGHWQGSFNGIRQYLAAGILFAGHRLILEKKLWQYLLVVLAASTFHVSAVVMILPYFLLNRKSDITQLVLLAVGAIIIRFSYEYVFSLIGSLKGKTMDMTDSYLTSSISVFRILTAFIPVVIYLVLCRKKDLPPEQNFYVNALFFHAFSMFASMGSAYLGRIGIYTGDMAVIGYGYLFQLIDDESTRKGIAFLVVGLLFFYWLYSVRAAGINNYMFCFSV